MPADEVYPWAVVLVKSVFPQCLGVYRIFDWGLTLQHQLPFLLLKELDAHRNIRKFFTVLKVNPWDHKCSLCHAGISRASKTLEPTQATSKRLCSYLCWFSLVWWEQSLKVGFNQAPPVPGICLFGSAASLLSPGAPCVEHESLPSPDTVSWALEHSFIHIYSLLQHLMHKPKAEDRVILRNFWSGLEI